MPLYFSAHTTACLTKQALRQLITQLLAASDMRVLRCVASQLGGRMLTEVEASDQTTLERWFDARNINCEWIMRIDLDGKDASVTEY